MIVRSAEHFSYDGRERRPAASRATVTPRTRIGVVGAGLRGRNHVRACLDLGVLGGIFDADPARLSAFDGDEAIKTFGDLGSLLKEVDAVIIAAPAASHASLALTTIAAGKHVLVEKPLALSTHDAERIAEAGERANVCVAVGQVLLYHPAISAMLSEIERGAIGRVSHIRARRCNLGRMRDVENVWWSFSPHDVAIAIAIVGKSPVALSGALHATRGRIADFAYADLEFSGARSAHLEASWLDPQPYASIEVFGSTGVLAFEDAGTACSLTRRACAADYRAEMWSEPTQTVPFANEAPLAAQLRAFISAVEDGTPIPTDARAGVAVVRVLCELNDVALRTKMG